MTITCTECRKDQAGGLVMRVLIMLEQTEVGFAVQVPDLAIVTFGKTIESAKKAARRAIQINLGTYEELGQPVPEPKPLETHLENPEFRELLFAYIEVPKPGRKIAA